MKADKNILRELGLRVAEIAALPIQAEKRNQWQALNRLKPLRPMVAIDQICWNEVNVDDELTLRCENPELRHWEQQLRQTLYKWKHLPADGVVDNFFAVPKEINGGGYAFDLGIRIQEHTLETDATNDVLSRAYTSQFSSMEDVEKIKMPKVSLNEAETNRREALAREIFDGVLEVRMEGVKPYLSVWDTISHWMNVETVMFTLSDDPDLMMAIVQRLVKAFMMGLDQLEAQGLLCGPHSWIHCTGAWADELPGAGYNPAKPTTKDMWMFGLAQVFANVSPGMFDEFEIEPNLPLFERFGLVYYGCCDPLDLKMDKVKKIPNVRKISISPWANKIRSAEGIGRDYVYSFKPNPAFLADDGFDEALVRKDLMETINICKEHGCPLELILKDISTVRYNPQRLWRWAEIAMECVNA